MYVHAVELCRKATKKMICIVTLLEATDRQISARVFTHTQWKNVVFSLPKE